jgi:hypothetical protein
MATKSDRSVLHVSEPPDADPHVRWCGEGKLKTSLYPIYTLIVYHQTLWNVELFVDLQADTSE